MYCCILAVYADMNSVSNGDIDGVPDQISWSVHPFTENAGKSVLLVLIILATCVGVFTWVPYVSAVIIALAFLVVSMAPYLFPTHYHADGNGLEIRFIGAKTFRSWDVFRNFYPHDVGAHLSTLRKPGPLDPFRGSFIRFEPGRREEIIAFLEKYIRRPADAGNDIDKINKENEGGD